jgi:hypothetical protein
MKLHLALPTSLLLLLVMCTPLFAQDESVLEFEQSNYESLEGLPILEDLGVNSTEMDDFGAIVDSTYRHKNIAGMLTLAAVLYDLETDRRKTSDFTTSAKLIGFADQMMEYRLDFEYDSVLVSYYLQTHKELGIELTTGQQENLERAAIIHNPDNSNGGNSTRDLSNNATLVVINKKSELVYLYVNDEFVGPLYGNKTKRIAIRSQCEHVYAETAGFNKSGKKICAKQNNQYEWVIE